MIITAVPWAARSTQSRNIKQFLGEGVEEELVQMPIARYEYIISSCTYVYIYTYVQNIMWNILHARKYRRSEIWLGRAKLNLTGVGLAAAAATRTHGCNDTRAREHTHTRLKRIFKRAYARDRARRLSQHLCGPRGL